MFVVKKYESEKDDDGIWESKESEFGEFNDILDAIDEMKHQADKVYKEINEEEAVNYHLTRTVPDEMLEILISDDLRQIEIAVEYRDKFKHDRGLPNISNLLKFFAVDFKWFNENRPKIPVF